MVGGLAISLGVEIREAEQRLAFAVGVIVGGPCGEQSDRSLEIAHLDQAHSAISCGLPSTNCVLLVT